MNPEEVEFLAENEIVSILPSFTSSEYNLISGDVGPFRAGLPVNVPLWMAIILKKQNTCRIIPPDWMDVEKLEQIKENEKNSK